MEDIINNDKYVIDKVWTYVITVTYSKYNTLDV
jgi:hypothetical protein